MTTYTITPGNIAAICTVDYDGQGKTSFIYLAADKLPVSGHKDTAELFLALPKSVQSAINAHFAAVFALPVEQRGAYLKTCAPIEVQS